MQYSRSLLIVTGHSGSPVQPLVDRLVENSSDYSVVKPVGTERAIGYRGQDIENAMVGGKSAVIVSYDPEATSVLQNWAASEGIQTHTAFVSAPQELSFSRAMGNWQQQQNGQPMDTLLPEIETMTEKALLAGYERGEMAVMDKPHYQTEMVPNDVLRRFSAIIHSEQLWQDTVQHENTIHFEPVFGEDLNQLAGKIADQHADYAVKQGYAQPDPTPGLDKSPGYTAPKFDNSREPRM